MHPCVRRMIPVRGLALAAVAVSLLAVAGCAAGSGPTPLATVVAEQKALTEANTVALVYLRLPACTGTNGPVCSTPPVSASVKKASKAAYDAVVAAQAAIDADPGASKSATSASLAVSLAAMTAYLSLTGALPK